MKLSARGLGWKHADRRNGQRLSPPHALAAKLSRKPQVPDEASSVAI
jgi:hypothetical protein